MTQEEISQEIIRNVGGLDNIENFYHCMTRLRFVLRDASKFNEDAIRAVPGVIDTVKSGKENQLIIGAEVDKFYQGLLAAGVIGADDNGSAEQAPAERGRLTLRTAPKRLIETLVSIMAPVLPLIIGGGLVKVVLTLLTFAGMSKESLDYQIIYYISDAPFYFLPFFIANSAAKAFNCNNYLAMVMAGVLLHPTFTGLVSAGDPISLFGLPIRSVSYGSSVLPIILTVWAMSYIERVVERFTPKVLKTMLRPLLIILITAPLALIVLGPLGSYLGQGIYWVIDLLNQNVPWAVPTVMGIFSPILVMAGMHLSITPFAVMSVTNFGSETLMGPGMLGSNTAQGGVALAVALKEKMLDKREVALSGAITAFSGITEPALYGVTLKYKRALACVMIAGGISGFYAGITGVVRYAVASASFLSLPVFVGPDPNNIVNAVITAVMALVISFGLAWFLVPVQDGKGTGSTAEKVRGTSPAAPAAGPVELVSPVSGTAMALSEVADKAFASGALGGGVGIDPSSKTVCSPVAGTVSAFFPTGHAVGITTDAGDELLIHIGINTVQLEGRGFTSHVSQGQRVSAGQPLVDVDFDLVRKEGYDPTVIVVKMKAGSRDTVCDVHVGKVALGAPLFTVSD